MPGRALFASDWDSQARFGLGLAALGLGRIEGTATSGVFAQDFSFELLRPLTTPEAAR